MTRPTSGLALARGLRVLGVIVAVVAAYRGAWWGLLAALGGFVAGLGLSFRSWGRKTPESRPIDFEHALDLVRRAHAGRAAWACGLAGGDVIASAEGVLDDALERGTALVHLASVDGRLHVKQEADGAYVAVGDFPYGAGLYLADGAAAETETAADDLRRLVAGMRLAEEEMDATGVPVARRLAAIAGGAQTLEGVARAGVELVQQIAQRGAAIVVRDGASQADRVAAVSSAADPRLDHVTLAAGSPVARAIESGLPVITSEGEDIFGPGVPERRRRERGGTAYPLMEGHVGIGALVVLGPPVDPATALAEQLGRLVGELGPRIAVGRALDDATRRAERDALTGLRNRGAFEAIFARQRVTEGRVADAATGIGAPSTLIYVDLDHFKRLNDSLGHAAGDAALRHVAGLLEAQVREVDSVSRIGGEEFAVWLPGTPMAEGLEVAERIRRAVAGTAWHWSGTPRPLTVSCGVASYDETVADPQNLRGAADAALYRAKQAGRNRVEKAERSG